MYYKNGTKLHINLKDNNGYNLAKTNITVTINGVSYNKTTDDNGVVEMNIYLRPGQLLMLEIKHLEQTL